MLLVYTTKKKKMEIEEEKKSFQEMMNDATKAVKDVDLDTLRMLKGEEPENDAPPPVSTTKARNVRTMFQSAKKKADTGKATASVGSGTGKAGGVASKTAAASKADILSARTSLQWKLKEYTKRFSRITNELYDVRDVDNMSDERLAEMDAAVEERLDTRPWITEEAIIYMFSFGLNMASYVMSERSHILPPKLQLHLHGPRMNIEEEFVPTKAYDKESIFYQSFHDLLEEARIRWNRHDRIPLWLRLIGAVGMALYTISESNNHEEMRQAVKNIPAIDTGELEMMFEAGHNDRETGYNDRETGRSGAHKKKRKSGGKS